MKATQRDRGGGAVCLSVWNYFTIAPRGNETVAKRRKRWRLLEVRNLKFPGCNGVAVRKLPVFQIENAVICYSIIPMPVTPPWAVATMLKFRKRTVGGYSCGPRGVLHNMRAVLCANRGVNIK